MTWSATSLWWIATGVLVVLELSTGTFYLLMLALGTAAGALSAWAGLGATGQLLTAALVGGGAVALWHVRRPAGTTKASTANPDLHLDLGSQVVVHHWNPQGHATVQHRGATWQARHQGEAPPAPGLHVIVAVESLVLVLSPIQS